MQQQSTPGAAAPQQAAGLDPNQQKAMQLMLRQGMAFLTESDHANAIVTNAEHGDPKQAVANAVVPLLQTLDHAARQAGVNISMVTTLAVGIQLIGVLAKMLESVKLLTEQQIPGFCADVAKMCVAKHNASVQGGAQGPSAAGPTPAPQPGGMMAPQGAQA